MTLIAFTVLYCVEYLPGDGQKRLKHVGKLPHVCIFLDIDIFVNCNWVDTWWQYLYLIIVQLLEYTQCKQLLHIC